MTPAQQMLSVLKIRTDLWSEDGQFVASFATPWASAPKMVTWGTRTSSKTLTDTIPGENGQDGITVHSYNEGPNFVLLDELKL